MNLSVAVILGSVAIAIAIGMSHRFTISSVERVDCSLATPPSHQCVGAWRADNWTGSMDYCEYDGINVSKRAICQHGYWSQP
jgi:hypothetical protein